MLQVSGCLGQCYAWLKRHTNGGMVWQYIQNIPILCLWTDTHTVVQLDGQTFIQLNTFSLIN